MVGRSRLALAAVAAGLAVSASAYPSPEGASDVPSPTEFSRAADEKDRTWSEIAQWPPKARELAAEIVREYGVPDEIQPAQLIWRRRRPWTRIAVFRDAQSPERPGNLLESLRYEVPLRRWRALCAFERGAAYDPVLKELVARTDSEETNLLALNLADEVIQGRLTPEQANALFDRTRARSSAGQSPPAMDRLMFSPELRRLTRQREGLNDEIERTLQRLNGRK